VKKTCPKIPKRLEALRLSKKIHGGAAKLQKSSYATPPSFIVNEKPVKF